MSAIDYATMLASLDAALATATGADLALGTDIRSNIATLGAELTARFTPSVDTAKTAWAPRRQRPSMKPRKRRATCTASPASPRRPTSRSTCTTTARCARACPPAAALASNAFLQRVVSQHRATWNAAFSAGPESASEYTTARARLPYSRTVTSAASLERQIYALLAEATSWLALAAL